MVYFIAFAIANAPALSTTLPSLEVSTILSASSGAMRSGLFVCCPWSHFCSSAATACSVPPPCAHAVLANRTKASEPHIKRLFIRMSPCWLRFSGAIGYSRGGDVKRSIRSARSKNFPLGVLSVIACFRQLRREFYRAPGGRTVGFNESLHINLRLALHRRDVMKLAEEKEFACK